MKHTKGKVKTSIVEHKKEGLSIYLFTELDRNRVSWPASCSTHGTLDGSGDWVISPEECRANASLICEAFNVTNETGKSPRQLAEINEKYLEALQSLQSILCDSEGYPCFEGSDGDIIEAEKAFSAIKNATK